MDIKQYTKDAARTVSDKFFKNLVSPTTVLEHLLTLEYNANILDVFKKTLFYGKPAKEPKPRAVLASENYDEEELHHLLGMFTEVGELSEVLRAKWAGEDVGSKPFDESGDILWYWANMVRKLGGDPEKIMEANIAKLRARFPEKFTQDAAINRTESSEKVALEAHL